MPNRILRDWTDSEPVNSLSCQAERFFIRLIMKADDYGRLFASPKLLRPSMFPLLLDQVRETDVQRWTAECEKAGLVRLYTVGGKQFIQVENFRQRSRAVESKYPDPPNGGHMTVEGPTHDGHMLTYAETYAETETEAQTPLSAGADDGERFPPEMLRLWDQSPPKARERSSRKQCLAEWKRQKCGRCPDAVMAGLDAWKRSAKWMEQAGQFVPALHRWLSHRQWTEPPEPFDPHAVGLDPADAAMIDRLYGERRSA